MVVFDPDRVADRATFEAPTQYAVGIEHVIVEGRVAIRTGEQTAPGHGVAVKLKAE